MERYTGPAMSLGNLRALGMRSVKAFCGCGHQAIIDVSGLPDGLEVPSVKHRLRCTSCGERPRETRPNWLEYRSRGDGRTPIE